MAFLILYLAKHNVEIYSLFSSKVPTQKIYTEQFIRDSCDIHIELSDYITLLLSDIGKCRPVKNSVFLYYLLFIYKIKEVKKKGIKYVFYQCYLKL